MNEKIDTPLVSVVMPAYKEQEPILRKSIYSILNQTFRDFEFIIILDAPDNLEAKKLIEEYSNNDKRIKLLINEKNLGVSTSLNRGIKEAKGMYIARQDADDESLPKRLEKQVSALLNEPDIGIIGTAIEYIDEKNNSLMKRFYKKVVGKEIKRFNPVAHPSLILKKDLFEQFGYYDESISSKHVEDYDLWLRFYLGGVKFRNIDEVLYKYYQSKENIKSKNTKRQLLNTIKLKWRYHGKLKFGFGDYCYIMMELIVYLLPAFMITKLFYLIKK
jgi:glycosyltransferase involved in cell wall biosynthesis